MLKGKIRLINCNIDEEEDILSIDENSNLKDIQLTLNMCIDSVINLLDDETSIYEGYNLSAINDEITISELKELLSQHEKIFIIAEDVSDIDYSVFLVFDEK